MRCWPGRRRAGSGEEEGHCTGRELDLGRAPVRGRRLQVSDVRPSSLVQARHQEARLLGHALHLEGQVRTLIIAEPGSTHEGDYDTMLRLVKAAASAGCDVYKSQWTSSAARMCARRHAPEYLDSYKKLQYPLAWHRSLREVCREAGMQYGCTVYIPGDAALVAPFVDYLKVSSFEATDRHLLYEVAKTYVPFIVSAGMEESWQPVVSALQYWNVWPWALLHCCSSYPAPLSALNLGAIRAGLGSARCGFSDHSRDVRVGAWAASAGATVLETHFRLDECDISNRDYAVAFTPLELGLYVRTVRDAQSALGDGIKRVQDCEMAMLQYRVGAQ